MRSVAGSAFCDLIVHELAIAVQSSRGGAGELEAGDMLLLRTRG